MCTHQRWRLTDKRHCTVVQCGCEVVLTMASLWKQSQSICRSPGIVPSLGKVEQDDHLHNEEDAGSKPRQVPYNSTAPTISSSQTDLSSTQYHQLSESIQSKAVWKKGPGEWRLGHVVSVRTIQGDDAIGEEEWQRREQKPQTQLDHPVPVVQILVPLVALVLDTQGCQCHERKEELHR